MSLINQVRAIIKQAEEIAPQPDLVAGQNAEMAADQLAVNASALQSGNTVEALHLESLQKGLNTPTAVATPEDKVIELQKAAAVAELVEGGMDFYNAVDAVAQADSELQKEAAFNQLIEEGYSFDDAALLVKAASEGELDANEDEVEKQAAVSELMEAGYGFDDAVALVKEAAADYDERPGYGNVMGMNTRSLGRLSLEGMAGTVAGAGLGLGAVAIGAKTKAGRKAMARLSRAVKAHSPELAQYSKYAAPGLAGGVGGMVSGIGAAAHGSMASQKNYLNEIHDRAQEKKAALDELMEAGYGFDDAVEIVKEAGLAEASARARNAIAAAGEAIGKGWSNTKRFGRGVKRDIKPSQIAQDYRDGVLGANRAVQTAAGIGAAAALGVGVPAAVRAIQRRRESQ